MHGKSKYSHDQYWAVIDEINWNVNGTCHCEKMKAGLMRRYKSYEGRKLLLEVRSFVSERWIELDKRIEEWDKTSDNRVTNYGGDDSYNDMLNHAVGMGKAFFQNALNDPCILNELNVIESLSYVLPSEFEDWDEIEVDHHVHNAVKALGYIDVALHTGKKPTIDQWNLLLVLRERFLKFVDTEDVQAYVGTWDKKTDYDLHSKGVGYVYANTLNDAYEYLID